ncbi:MAG: hypothetical protein HY238_13050 [Acidobacteria bacterium]|nr:hypothetical protein [Acidobacteriota bacterium]
MRSLHKLLTASVVLLLLPIPPVFANEEDPGPDPEAAQKDADEEQEPKEKKSTKGARFMMRKHPTFRMGKWFRMDFRVKFQHDFRSFDPELTGDEADTSNLRKMRVGVEGTLFKHFEYEVEREIRNEVTDLFNFRTRETHALWRDVYGNFRYFRRVQVKAGQFKLPFGMDQLHGGSKRDFVFRSLIGERLAPGRDLGIMLHGRLFDRGLQYQAGFFEHDGWKAHAKDYSRTGERTFAGHLAGTPFRLFRVPEAFKDLEIGGAFTESPVTEGLNSLRGRTWVITHNYFTRINVRGHRLRLGAELNWEPGPFSVKGEFIHVREERFGQGLRGENLPDLIHRGWYLSTSWVVTGEKKAGGIEPRKPFLWWGSGGGHGLGAVEMAGRYEQIRHGSAEHPGLPSRSSRAANILSESERVATFGVNWYLNRFMKIQFNAIRELIEDAQRTPIAGQDTYWSRYVRMQFVL